MLIKLATLIAKQTLPKGTVEDETKIMHVPRPVQEQTERKKDPIRIIGI